MSSNVFWFSVYLVWLWACQFLIFIVVFLFSWRIGMDSLVLNGLACVWILASI